MSALSNLYGLYPPGTGPTLPNVADELLLPPIPDIKDAFTGLTALPHGF